MDFRDFWRTARKRWIVIVFVTLLCVVASALLALLSPKTYEASTRLFVSTAGSDNSTALLQGSSFSQQRVKSYADVVTSPKVLGPVIRQLGLDVRPSQLAARVTATAPLDTVLIDVSVTDHSPQLATRLAHAIGHQFIRTVADLETTGNDGTSPVKVTVIAEPTLPSSPISPRPGRNVGLGLVVGALLGCGLALLRESLDTRIKGPDDCRDATESTVLGGVAFDADASSHPLVTQTDPHSARAEAFRTLRTNLQYVDAAKHPRSIVFTSSVPDEGKTTTAANLATTVAASGAKVCVVEADLRRPRLLSYMGLEGGVGLTTVLIGQAALTEVLQDFAGLSVLGAGHIPPNPSELLGSTTMRETLRELEQRFDVVIIDAPPLLPVTDAAVLSTIADGTVVVVGTGSTRREQLAASIRALEHVNANILGLVLNKLPIRGPDSYSYTYYREGYRSSPRSEHAKSRRAESAARR